MRDKHRLDAERASGPNLLDYMPKNVWREVYRGRWSELEAVQKTEFIVEIVFFLIFFGAFIYTDYLRDGNVMGLVLAFGGVWVILGAFFWLLTRYIR